MGNKVSKNKKYVRKGSLEFESYLFNTIKIPTIAPVIIEPQGVQVRGQLPPNLLKIKPKIKPIKPPNEAYKTILTITSIF